MERVVPQSIARKITSLCPRVAKQPLRGRTANLLFLSIIAANRNNTFSQFIRVAGAQAWNIYVDARAHTYLVGAEMRGTETASLLLVILL
jgi:hypothetical protein